ncbi:phosphotransferase [Citrobacter braakii]
MTNINHLCEIDGEMVVVRIPGKHTEYLINRRNEKINCEEVTKIKLNPKLFFYDERSGIKVTKYIEQSKTFNASDLCCEENIEKISQVLKKLHNAKLDFINYFNPFREYERYKRSGEMNTSRYANFNVCERKFFKIEDILNKLGMDISPCHNDLVPENIIANSEGVFLIDWEYSGYNDAYWDVAALIEEAKMSTVAESRLINYYCDDFTEIEKVKEKILLHKICQNFLWAAWTIVKEKEENLFGDYGVKRYNRCQELITDYENNYNPI